MALERGGGGGVGAAAFGGHRPGDHELVESVEDGVVTGRIGQRRTRQYHHSRKGGRETIHKPSLIFLRKIIAREGADHCARPHRADGSGLFSTQRLGHLHAQPGGARQAEGGGALVHLGQLVVLEADQHGLLVLALGLFGLLDLVGLVLALGFFLVLALRLHFLGGSVLVDRRFRRGSRRGRRGLGGGDWVMSVLDEALGRLLAAGRCQRGGGSGGAGRAAGDGHGGVLSG